MTKRYFLIDQGRSLPHKVMGLLKDACDGGLCPSRRSCSTATKRPFLPSMHVESSASWLWYLLPLHSMIQRTSSIEKAPSAP